MLKLDIVGLIYSFLSALWPVIGMVIGLKIGLLCLKKGIVFFHDSLLDDSKRKYEDRIDSLLYDRESKISTGEWTSNHDKALKYNILSARAAYAEEIGDKKLYSRVKRSLRRNILYDDSVGDSDIIRSSAMDLDEEIYIPRRSYRKSSYIEF